jgi:outer membrane protein TolC
LLGLPETGSIDIDSLTLKAEDIKPFEQYETLAFQNRKDIQALQIRNKAWGTALKAAKAESYPTIALTGGYLAADVPGFITITNAVNAGIGIQYNLAGLWKSNSKLLQAKGHQEEIMAQQGELNDQIRMEINRAYEGYLLNNKKIEVYEKTAQQASENYRITKNKYDNSLATITDLLEADVANQQSELNVILAKADSVSLYNKLLQTAGVLTYY